MTTPTELDKLAEEWAFSNNVPHTARDCPAWKYDIIAYKQGYQAAASHYEANQEQAATIGVLNCEIASYKGYIKRLEKELSEQCRLNGMGSEREARLMARVSELEKRVERLTRVLANVEEGIIGTFGEEPSPLLTQVQDALKQDEDKSDAQDK